MTDNKFISVRLIDGKPRKVIVDESGTVVNRSHTKEELKDIIYNGLVVSNLGIRRGKFS